MNHAQQIQLKFSRYPMDTYPDEDKVTIDPVKLLGLPLKIHEMLRRPEFNHIISWLPHGRAWKVHKPKAFEDEVIPKFFVSCKYTSFVRQANGWGFRRILKGQDRNAYYHRYFLRGRSDLCRLMKRPGVRQKFPLNPDTEPDFYTMPPIEQDHTLVALERKESSGNRAVKNAAEVHRQSLEKYGSGFCKVENRSVSFQDCNSSGTSPTLDLVKSRQVPIGDIYTRDIEGASYELNSDPLAHYDAVNNGIYNKR